MKLKRVFLVLLVVLLLSSCSGNGATLMDFIAQGSDNLDFEGMTFRIFHDGNRDLRYTDNSSGASSQRHEKRLARLDEIEKKYNCTIETTAGKGSEFPLAYASNIPFADIIRLRLNSSYSMYLGGYFTPINEISTIDLYGGKYGSHELLDAVTLNGDTIAFHPALWGDGPAGFSDGMVYNPDILAQINMPTPHEFREQGKWNWETLEQMGKACMTLSTEDDPVYLSSSNDYFFRMLVLSNGGEYIVEKSDGKYGYGLSDPRVTEALQFGHKLYADGHLEKVAGSYDYFIDKFSKDTYLFLCEYSHFGVTDLISTGSDDVAGEMQSVGYCYAPDGPQAVDNTRGVISHEHSFYSVTREKTDDMDTLGNFMELLFASLDEDPNTWVEEFTTMKFFDPDSAEVFMTKATNLYFDKVIFAFKDNTMFDIIEEAAKNGNIAESIQSIASKTEAALDSGINAGVRG